MRVTRPRFAIIAVTGITHDNGEITAVKVNGAAAKIIKTYNGVADWSIEVPLSTDGNVTALATDDAGNVERPGHVMRVGSLTRR